MAQGFNTRLLHGSHRGSYPNGATLPPITQSNAFVYSNAAEQEAVFANKQYGYAYSRSRNPTVAELERAITAMEGGVETVAYGSGMAALTACFTSIVRRDEEIVASPGLYGGSVELLELLEQLGIRVRFAQENTPEAFARLVGEDTRAIFCETIGNPRLDVSDIAGLAGVAHAAGVPLVVDNTVTTPYLLRPIELGADLVINSTSKFINGSSDALGGALTYSGKFAWDFERFGGLKPFARYRSLALVPYLRSHVSSALGGCMAPQTAFYTFLGLETLGLRMERICANALALAEHLESVEEKFGITVSYPGLSAHPQHDLARCQLHGGFGGILTLRLGTRERAYRLLDELKLVSIVSNIGDVRTLAVHPATTIAAHLTPEQQVASGVYPDLVRVCVGIEDAPDLMADFDQALTAVQEGED